MLESLKKWASGWVAFFMIALLILSFAIWGIADYITGGAGGHAIATVGSKDISAQEFQREFGNELNTLSRQAGQRITYEQARTVGIDSRVLSQLIGSTAVEAHAEQLDLALSDTTVAAGLQSDPNFQSGGQFNRNLVMRLQQELGLSERSLLELRRKDDLRNQITTAMLRAIVVPDAMVDALAQWRGETRVVTHFTVDAEKLPPPPEPTDEDLKQTYEDNKTRFMTEPRRDLAILQLAVADLKSKADLTDDQIRKAYDQTKSAYEVPEKRTIEQIPFKDKAAAETALAAIKGGKDFLEVAKENGVSENDTKLGVKTKGELIDPKISDAAFKLPQSTVSDIIEGAFTTGILRVTNIEPGKVPTFDEVKDRVSDQLKHEWAAAQLQDYYSRVDDGRAEGRSLKDIAESLGMPFFEPVGVTRGNVDANGNAALTVPDANAIVAQGFRGDIGLEAEPVQLADGGYAWVDVKTITPAAQKTFEEVKSDAKRLWTEDRKRTLLSDATKGFVDALKAGEDFAKVAESAGGTLATTAAVGRTTIPDGLSQTAMTQAFALRTGEFGNAETADGKSRTVFRVDTVNKAPEPSVELKQQLTNELVQQLRTDSIASYVAALQERYGVSINQAQFRRATGADPGYQP